MKTIKLLAFVLSLFVGIATQGMTEKSDSQTRSVKSFNAIKVSSGIDLYLTQGNSEEVIVKADPDVIDEIITEVKEGILHIYIERSKIWGWNQSRKAYVTFDDLTAINASAGSDVYSENSFDLNNLKMDVSSGSDIKIDNMKAQSIWVETSSGSDAKLSGKVNRLEAKSSSGSDLDAGNLICETCEVSVSSGSDATVHVTKNLKANASSGGDIRYKGNPTHKDIHESSGGDVYNY